jgi:hypothetical protein
MRRTGIALFVLSVVGVRCGCSEGEREPAGNPILSRIETPDRLIGGLAASGQIGDYLFESDKARFIVQGPDTATGWGIFGGSLVDLAPVRADGRTDDRLQEMFVQCDLRAFRPERAEIVSDGRDGQPAVLRFVGADAGIPFLDAIIVREPLMATITVDYVLAPGSDTLELVISIKDERKTEPREISCGLVLIRGDENAIFLHGIGADPDQAGGEQPYIAAAAWDAPGSWVLYQKDRDLNVIVAQLGIVPIGPKPVPFLANATVVERYYVSVGANGDVESALTAMRSAKGDPTARHAVRLSVEALPEIPEGAVVFQLSEETRPITAAKVAADGIATAHVPAGTYRAEVFVAGRPFESFELEVAGDVERTHAFETIGRLHLEVSEVDRGGAALGATPARLWVIGGAGAKIHEQYVLASDDVLLPAGEHTAYLSRGPAHEIFSAPITIPARDTVTLEAKIPRVVDLTGWVTLDTHVHGGRSNDSHVSKRSRVLGAVAEGVDLLIATDHDGVTDYRPAIDELGLQDHLQTVAGVEMSMLYGHMNGFPLAPTPERYFSPSWAVYEAGRFQRMLAPHEVAARLREHGASIVQANHPRSGQGVFGYVGLDPATGELSGTWPDIDCAEILNGKRLDEYPAVLADLFAIIGSGRRVTVTGSSDTHSEFSGIGYARTLVRAGSAQDLDEVWASLREGRAVAANGPYLFATANGAQVGDTLRTGDPVELAIRVEAPSWVSAERLVVYQNGAPMFEKTLSESDRDPAAPHVRFNGTVTATPAADAYYMVEVSGSASPPLIDDSRSVTNPIWVDVDGNGFSLSR